LSKIQSFFGVGTIITNKKNGQVTYSVKSVEDINSVIIPHFNKYSLLTKKQADFILFKKIVEIMNKKQHLNKEGLIKILELRASLKGINKIKQIKSGMNTGRKIDTEVNFDDPEPTRNLNSGSQNPSLINSVNNIQKRSFHTNVRGRKRIGPHNNEVIDVIIGSLLGRALANKRSGEGIRICYRQSIIHKEYLFWLYNFFNTRGYASNLPPRQYSRIIKNKPGMIYYGFEFNTFTFTSFN
jgi:LAGLIDADG endonuclease/LAGLIDADG DNA endonuclease family